MFFLYFCMCLGNLLPCSCSTALCVFGQCCIISMFFISVMCILRMLYNYDVLVLMVCVLWQYSTITTFFIWRCIYIYLGNGLFHNVLSLLLFVFGQCSTVATFFLSYYVHLDNYLQSQCSSSCVVYVGNVLQSQCSSFIVVYVLTMLYNQLVLVLCRFC